MSGIQSLHTTKLRLEIYSNDRLLIKHGAHETNRSISDHHLNYITFIISGIVDWY